jgi:hypothetical protein
VLSDAGCDPSQATVDAGKIAFDVTNQGSSKVTEFYVKQNDKTIGEVENVVKGSPKTLTVTLKSGTYDMVCPNGTTTEKASLVVTNAATDTTNCADAGIGGYGNGSGNNGASTDASSGAGGSGDGTGSDCGTAGTSSNQNSGSVPPGGSNGGGTGSNGGGVQPGGEGTPNVTTGK